MFNHDLPRKNHDPHLTIPILTISIEILDRYGFWYVVRIFGPEFYRYGARFRKIENIKE